MRAGFAKANITPPLGTRLLGFGGRDRSGSQGVHDPVYVRALSLEYDGERALILAYDLCFFSREVADRFKGALGRLLDLTPRQILINFSHTHCGPNTGMWSYSDYLPPDTLYLHDLETATLTAAQEAADAMRPVDVFAGTGRTRLPLSRRKVDANGYAQWLPAPDGPTYNDLPVVLLRDDDGVPISLLFSVSCHPSTTGGYMVSADYPGVACEMLAAHLKHDCALFLQGVGGDTKARMVGDGEEWRSGSWGDVRDAGELVAGEVIATLNNLTLVEPKLCCALEEMHWPFAPLPTREEFARIRDNEAAFELLRLWAERMVQRLDRGEALPEMASILAHGIQLAEGVRMVGLEGEAVAEWGPIIAHYYGAGVTLPMGYTDGTQLYLPVSHMISEQGYEVESYYEYGAPAPLLPDMEPHVIAALGRLRKKGVE